MSFSSVDAEIKSSLPGLWKYTGRRNVPFSDSQDWLQAKRRDDDIGDLWRVHDKLYNLTPFIHKHPGGADWIELTRGTDITEAFESAHMLNVGKVEKILDKYFVREASARRNSPYTFKPDGFYQTLKRRAEPILKNVGTGPSKQVELLQDILCILYISFVAMGTYLESIPTLIAAGLLLTFSTISAHNFFHLRDTWRRYYFELSLLSSQDWRISHALSHHMYPNTLLDAELTMLEPFVVLLPKSTKNFWWNQLFSPICCNVTALVGFHVAFFKRLGSKLTGKQNFRQEILIPVLEIVFLLNIAPSSWSGFRSWALVHAVFAYVFGVIGLAASHHHPVCFHDGDEARPDSDFGLCQLDASSERTDDDRENLLVALTTFGFHPLHHLFPTVCHSKLQYLKPVVKETLEEFEEEINKFPHWQLFTGMYLQAGRNKPNPFVPRIRTSSHHFQ
ncbi:unnamed protein product [Allacma fusca]|uniref:Cytochrome b5 heme-binding domain-containing protein n=1 Tax=Allacma fusca TaxID=39272 RepID=A0A8J2LA10_9HEXA|nr:unnamed protein product [Allacma fusca]